MEHRNLAALHRAQARRLGPRIALRTKRWGLYSDLSWAAYHEQVRACAAGLVEVGIQAGERVGLLAENRVEWLIADLAIMAVGAVNVPPHAPLTARQVHFQLQETGVRWLFVSTAAQLEKARSIQAELPDLRGIVVFDRVPPASGIVSWEGFLQRGRRALGRVGDELDSREASLSNEQLATIMYTSGTTGNPKGVMLTHGNLLSNASAMNQASPRAENAVILNWLPFSHIYARTVDHYLSIVAGVTMCLAESAETLLQNLAETQPTQLASVPRFYEKVLGAVAGPNVEESRQRLRRIFGRRLDWLSSGGAPLPLPIAQAYHDAGVFLLQGYGLTESSPVISFNHKDAFKLDSVGQPLPGIEVRIAEDGEVLTRGPHVMKGYWKNPTATAEALEDGWLHTGDLGHLDADGFLSITGRKKELLVLSSGKKVHPAQIEGLLSGDPCIDQVVVHGEQKNFLTALIVPNWPNLRAALAAAGRLEVGCTDGTLARQTLAKHAGVYRFLEQRVAHLLEGPRSLGACQEICCPSGTVQHWRRGNDRKPQVAPAGCAGASWGGVGSTVPRPILSFQGPKTLEGAVDVEDI